MTLIKMELRPSIWGSGRSLQARQVMRLERAGQSFLVCYPQYQRHNMHFDIMPVALYHPPVHIQEAWRPAA